MRKSIRNSGYATSSLGYSKESYNYGQALNSKLHVTKIQRDFFADFTVKPNADSDMKVSPERGGQFFGKPRK